MAGTTRAYQNSYHGANYIQAGEKVNVLYETREFESEFSRRLHGGAGQLEHIITAWPELPGLIKEAIKTLIQTQKKP